MQKLRSLHLYLGCIFAPMLLFFAISGIWQTYATAPRYQQSKALALLSTIHISKGLKAGGNLTSPLLQWFVLIMAVSFIVTTALGIVMALNFGKSRRAAFYCLAAGVVVPLVVILLTMRIR